MVKTTPYHDDSFSEIVEIINLTKEHAYQSVTNRIVLENW